MFDSYASLKVVQTRKGCFQEMLGCEANTEMVISTMDAPNDILFTAAEETPCWIRFCCPTIRNWDMHIYPGDTRKASPSTSDRLVSFHRELRCMPCPGKCCCKQEVSISAGGKDIGDVREALWWCVPMYQTHSPHDNTNPEYNLHMPVCCGGMCVNCCAEGTKCRIPFYVFPPGAKPDNGNKIGFITKVWSGFTNELFTDADTFEVKFPEDATSDQKARLLGATFLLNQLYFETTQDQGAS
jgi:hypothetical protein